jgi:hypothetical protein
VRGVADHRVFALSPTQPGALTMSKTETPNSSIKAAISSVLLAAGLATLTTGCMAGAMDEEDQDELESVAAGDDMALSGGSHLWEIHLVQGTTSSKWGDGNAPDLYVARYCNGKFRSASEAWSNNYHPEWQETLLSASGTDGYIASCDLRVYDADNNENDHVGTADLGSLAQKAIDNHGSWVTKTYTVHAASSSKITVKMRRR